MMTQDITSFHKLGNNPYSQLLMYGVLKNSGFQVPVEAKGNCQAEYWIPGWVG